jgi:hypothetical protein
VKKKLRESSEGTRGENEVKKSKGRNERRK